MYSFRDLILCCPHYLFSKNKINFPQIPLTKNYYSYLVEKFLLLKYIKSKIGHISSVPPSDRYNKRNKIDDLFPEKKI